MTIIETAQRTVAPTRWSVGRDGTSVAFTVKTFWGLATVSTARGGAFGD